MFEQERIMIKEMKVNNYCFYLMFLLLIQAINLFEI